MESDDMGGFLGDQKAGLSNTDCDLHLSLLMGYYVRNEPQMLLIYDAHTHYRISVIPDRRLHQNTDSSHEGIAPAGHHHILPSSALCSSLPG